MMRTESMFPLASLCDTTAIPIIMMNTIMRKLFAVNTAVRGIQNRRNAPTHPYRVGLMRVRDCLVCFLREKKSIAAGSLRLLLFCRCIIRSMQRTGRPSLCTPTLPPTLFR